MIVTNQDCVLVSTPTLNFYSTTIDKIDKIYQKAKKMKLFTLSYRTKFKDFELKPIVELNPINTSANEKFYKLIFEDSSGKKYQIPVISEYNKIFIKYSQRDSSGVFIEIPKIKKFMCFLSEEGRNLKLVEKKLLESNINENFSNNNLDFYEIVIQYNNTISCNGVIFYCKNRKE